MPENKYTMKKTIWYIILDLLEDYICRTDVNELIYVIVFIGKIIKYMKRNSCYISTTYHIILLI